ncbi:hypothetical protein AB6N24_14340 [Cellulomonas sp. 179-A 4D5 NHS]|uniref:hypothetical protein n=1 Tax=Cellulomonas sp. 179-A 4D5 NHS TaxID=3142378 RepID=UPI0039A30CBE
MFSAWGDESGSVASRDPDIYLMGAVLAAPEAVADLRAAMIELQRPGEKKIHWRADSEDRHDKVIGVIGELPIEGVIVVRHGMPDEKDERRRRKCFETFAPELVAAGCTDLVLESRGSAADQRDRKMLDALRSQQRLDGVLRLDHAAGPVDPALWIADAVCGALVASRVGNPRWWRVLERRMTVHLVEDAPQT